MFLHAKTAKSAEIYYLSYFTLALEGRKLRYDKSAQRVYPPLPFGCRPMLRWLGSKNKIVFILFFSHLFVPSHKLSPSFLLPSLSGRDGVGLNII